MNDVSDWPVIEVAALRVGLFIHIEGGWMAHPFALSSFKLQSSEQIHTLQGLGLRTVRWSPEQSDAQVVAALNAALNAKPSAAKVEPLVGADSPPKPKQTAQQAALAAERARKSALSAQRQALAVCEAQFSEATQALRQINDRVVAAPVKAAEQVRQLSSALVDKMAGDDDVCIRLLTEGAGDKACAHALNVAVISLLMGRAFGWNEADLIDMATGALLHDIGKLELPDRLRHRDDHFTSAEVKAYEEHVALGVAHARRLGLSPGATMVIAQHHEMADGSGFPMRIGAERMSAAARVVALVNRYDKLCNPAVPARAITPHEALSLLFAQGSHKFDTAILGAFIKMMGVYPAGSVVQLTDDHYALVVGVNSSRPLKPQVLVFEPRHPREEALILDLNAHLDLGIRRSIKPQALSPEALAFLAPRQRVAYFFEPARLLEAQAVAA